MRRALPLVLLALLSDPARADIVFLKDGRKIEGRVIDLGDRLKIERKIGSVLVNKEDVLRIEVKEFTEAPAPAPAAPPPPPPPAAPLPAAPPASSPLAVWKLRPAPKIRLTGSFISLEGNFVIQHPAAWAADPLRSAIRAPKDDGLDVGVEVVLGESEAELPEQVGALKRTASQEWPMAVLAGWEYSTLGGCPAVHLEFQWTFEARKWRAYLQMVKNGRTLVTIRYLTREPAFEPHWYEADRLMRSLRFFKAKESTAGQRQLANGLLERGNADLKAGRGEAALRGLRDCAEIVGEIAVVQSSITRACLLLKDYRGAVVAAKAGLKTEPENPLLLWLLAKAYLDWGKDDDAAPALKKVMAADPENEEAFYQGGLLFSKKDHWTEAKDAWKRGLDANPDSTRLHFSLGQAWEKLGKPRDACDCYQRCLQLDATHAEARARLNTLSRK